jgi:hypothetical protein
MDWILSCFNHGDELWEVGTSSFREALRKAVIISHDFEKVIERLAISKEFSFNAEVVEMVLELLTLHVPQYLCGNVTKESRVFRCHIQPLGSAQWSTEYPALL